MERRTRLTLLFEQINSMNKSFILFVHCFSFKGILVNPGKTRVLIYTKKPLTSMEKLILIPCGMSKIPSCLGATYQAYIDV